MKKRIAMLLCLIMVLSVALCGCGSEKDQLVGVWTGTMNLADAVNIGMEEAAAEDPSLAEMAEYMKVESLTVTFTLTFTEDDTYTMVVNEDSLDAAMQGMMTELADGLLRYFEDLLAAEGVDMTVDELLAMSGMTTEDLAQQMYDSMAAEDLFGDLNSEGNFMVKDGKLFMSDGLDYAVDLAVYELYTVEGSTLTINKGSDSADEYDEYLYPMVFTKAG